MEDRVVTQLDRYLIRNILALTGIVAIVLIAIYTLAVFASGLGNVGQEGLSAWQLLKYSLLLVPGNAYILLPIIALLGTLLGVGGMARHGEITAMRAAGVSHLRIGRAILIAGVLLGISTFVLGNWLGPEGQREANQIRRQVGAGPGRSQWLREGRHIVRIRRLRSADRIDGITIYTLNSNGQLASTTHAKTALYLGGHWELRNVRRTDFASSHVSTSEQPTAAWPDGIQPYVLKLLILKENSLTAQGLFQLIHYLDKNHLDSTRYRMLLWRKLVEPITVMAMMLFALPFAGGRLRESGAGQRLLAGILIGVLFYVANKVSVSLGDIYGWWPALAAGAPTALLGVIGFFWLAIMP